MEDQSGGFGDGSGFGLNPVSNSSLPGGQETSKSAATGLHLVHPKANRTELFQLGRTIQFFIAGDGSAGNS
jgi:hypothetical protein